MTVAELGPSLQRLVTVKDDEQAQALERLRVTSERTGLCAAIACICWLPGCEGRRLKAGQAYAGVVTVQGWGRGTPGA